MQARERHKRKEFGTDKNPTLAARSQAIYFPLPLCSSVFFLKIQLPSHASRKLALGLLSLAGTPFRFTGRQSGRAGRSPVIHTPGQATEKAPCSPLTTLRGCSLRPSGEEIWASSGTLPVFHARSQSLSQTYFNTVRKIKKSFQMIQSSSSSSASGRGLLCAHPPVMWANEALAQYDLEGL